MQKICIVEDEFAIAEALILNLELEGFSVQHFASGGDAMKRLNTLAEASLVILDVMLPEFNGIDICIKLREFSDVPVLFLSAKGTTSDKIVGLKSGGTDYLSKPFDLEELLLRVNILARKSTIPEMNTIQIGNRIVDFKTYEVCDLNHQLITSLSKKEIALLQFFIEKENEVVSRDEILDNIWGAEQYPTSRTIDNFILTFRKLFEENPKEPNLFHSIRGVGYRYTKSEN